MSGTIVPWTSAGGDVCCCEDACYTDLQNEPLMPYSEDTWLPINNADYASLLAGGLYSTLINIDVTGSNATFSERHRVINQTIALDFSESINLDCYRRQSGSVSVVRTFSGSGSNFDYVTDVLFARSLGTDNTERKVSLTTIAPPPSSASPTFGSIALSGLSGLTFGVVLTAYVGNFSSFATGLCRNAGVPFTSSLSVGINTYVATGTTIACFVTLTSMAAISHTGNMSFVTTFTPSPP
jgi:hypothetical protein